VITVSPHALGCAPFGNLYRAVDDETVRETVAVAWDNGVRYFDTAPHYGSGLSEERLGAALGDYPRDEFVLSTKVGRLLVPDPAPGACRLGGGELFEVDRPWRRVSDYSRDGVLRSLESSLERLGLDRIDIVYVHDAEDHLDEALDGAFPALEELRSQGVIASYGAGMNEDGPLTRIVAETGSDRVMMAGRYNLLDRTAADTLLPLAQERGVAVVLAGVFGSGLFAADRPAPDASYRYGRASPEQLSYAHAVADLAESFGSSLPHVAVQFALTHPAVDSICLGASRSAHVGRNARLVNEPLPDGLLLAVLALPTPD
jgi:D-threo-aldose 1-dehydrogenase